jgi:hypothetical protein
MYGKMLAELVQFGRSSLPFVWVEIATSTSKLPGTEDYAEKA